MWRAFSFKFGLCPRRLLLFTLAMCYVVLFIGWEHERHAIRCTCIVDDGYDDDDDGDGGDDEDDEAMMMSMMMVVMTMMMMVMMMLIIMRMMTMRMMFSHCSSSIP